jgi:hypothetical protein
LTHTFDNVLANDLIKVVHRNDSRGVFVIQVGELRTQIEITLSRYMDCDRTTFWLTHAIKTPIQSFASRPRYLEADYPASALFYAVSNFTDWYRDAVEQGHKPSDDWLEDY